MNSNVSSFVDHLPLFTKALMRLKGDSATGKACYCVRYSTKMLEANRCGKNPRSIL